MGAQLAEIRARLAAAGEGAARVAVVVPFFGVAVLLESWGYTGSSMFKGGQDFLAKLVAFSLIGVVIAATHYFAKAITRRGWF